MLILEASFAKTNNTFAIGGFATPNTAEGEPRLADISSSLETTWASVHKFGDFSVEAPTDVLFSTSIFQYFCKIVDHLIERTVPCLERHGKRHKFRSEEQIRASFVDGPFRPMVHRLERARAPSTRSQQQDILTSSKQATQH